MLNPAVTPGTSSKRATRLIIGFTVVPGIVVVTLLVLYVALFQAYSIPSGSMSPTLQVHDVVYATRFSYLTSSPKDGELVAFLPPVATGNRFIKRIVGLPGERLSLHDGKLYRNDAVVDEPYITGGTNYELKIKNYAVYVDGTAIDPHDGNIPPRSAWQAPDRIPAGCYVVLGDNRDDSEDSHIWGFAQNGGTFATGPRAGEPAGSFQHAKWIVAPANRRASLP